MAYIVSIIRFTVVRLVWVPIVNYELSLAAAMP